MRNALRDVRFGLRILARNKGFTAVAILALALGIGPNVAIFSIIWATFLAPLPYPQADQLVVVWNHYKGQRDATSADAYAQWAAQSHSFQQLYFQSWFAKHLTNADHSHTDINGNSVSPGFYTRMLGVPIALGTEDESVVVVNVLGVAMFRKMAVPPAARSGLPSPLKSPTTAPASAFRGRVWKVPSPFPKSRTLVPTASVLPANHSR